MTKHITGVAVLMLYEEGKFFLTDSVYKYLPALGNMKVAVVETDSQTGKETRYTVPANARSRSSICCATLPEWTTAAQRTQTAS